MNWGMNCNRADPARAPLGLQQNEVVVGLVAPVSPRTAGTGELLAIGGFPQGADRIRNGFES